MSVQNTAAKNRINTAIYYLKPKVAPAKIVKALRDAGHSCLTCNNTKKAYGKILVCNCKNKSVQHYNICEHHVEIKLHDSSYEGENL